MGKTLITLIIFLSCFVLNAQNSGRVDLNWNGLKSDAVNRQLFQFPDCGEECYSDGVSLKWSRSIEVDSPVNELSFKLSNVSFVAISPSELGDLDLEHIPNGLQYGLRNALSRKRNYAQLFISPIYKDDTVIKKVVSFSFSYSNASLNQTLSAKSSAYGNSLLNSGSWYRFRVDNTGVHRITRSFLESLGINTSNVDPRTIKIYGNGGPSMPLINSETVAFDPPEIAITVNGEQDGVFNSNDEILFYATATDTEYVESNDSFINPYSDDSYYYITTGGAIGKRILPFVQPAGTPNITFDYYHARQHYEVDERNIGQIGRIWYGERFDFEPSQTFDFTFEDVDSSRPASIKVTTAAISDLPTSMQISVNGTIENTTNYAALPATSSTILGRRGVFESSSLIFNSNDVSVTLDFDNGGDPSAQGFLDYIQLEVPQALTSNGRQFRFRNNEAALTPGIGVFQISNASDVEEVWNISDPFNISKIVNNAQAGTFSFQDGIGEVKEYLAVVDGDYFTPVNISNRVVSNQNLKGTIFLDSSGNFRDIDYLIITPAFLKSEAQRLANYHITTTNLNTKVVTLQEIYNEFSEGEQDIVAIRNFVKYVYDNASTPAARVQYLNMFGDASFDYKNRIAIRDNVVPSFLSDDSTSLTRSYVTDDFFTFMDANEGTVASSNLMDLAVGRMIVSNIQEAREMVNKSIAYTAEDSFKRWRNDVYLIGDDIDDPGSDADLQTNVNDLANQISLNRPDYNVYKILLDSYDQVSTAGGFRYPDVVEDVNNAFEQGALVINYFGHGNEDGLAQEFIITQSQAANWRNPDNYPLFITVTCEFSRYDNPLRLSGGEVVYLNEEGGAIGLVATNRLIFISDGVALNRTLDQYLFSYNNVEAISMAEALRLAKVDPALSNRATRRVIAFIGDPALKLALPDPSVALTAVNDVPVATNSTVLRGLDRVKFSGEVRDLQDNLIPNYNGVVSVTLFDKRIDRTTLGNDNATDNANQLILLDFDQLGEVLFRGQASVTNGVFDVEFVMPRDTQIPLGSGRLSFYAKRDGVPEDKNGYNLDLQIGGINTNAPQDDLGPEIDLYMNDTNFVSGGITDSDPFILAFLNDDNGINTASGIGHDITAILDGDEANPFILNDYYEADVDDFTIGKVYFPLRDIEPGLHTIKFTAWDTYNNSAMTEIQFLVTEDDEIKLERVLNYPNPFTTYTEFWFNHNRPFEPLDVQVQVMTITGKVVWSEERTITTTGFTSREITWDGTDDFGQRLGKGVYVYKINVKSTLTNQQASKTEKLVIL